MKFQPLMRRSILLHGHRVSQGQKVFLISHVIHLLNFDDFQKRHHLLSDLGQHYLVPRSLTPNIIFYSFCMPIYIHLHSYTLINRIART